MLIELFYYSSFINILTSVTGFFMIYGIISIISRYFVDKKYMYEDNEVSKNLCIELLRHNISSTPFVILKYTSMIYHTIMFIISFYFLYFSINDKLWGILQNIPIGYYIFYLIAYLGQNLHTQEKYDTKFMQIYNPLYATIFLTIPIIFYRYSEYVAYIYLTEVVWNSFHTINIMNKTKLHKNYRLFYKVLCCLSFYILIIRMIINIMFIIHYILQSNFIFSIGIFLTISSIQLIKTIYMII